MGNVDDSLIKNFKWFAKLHEDGHCEQKKKTCRKCHENSSMLVIC